jgi:hypothetical protein
LRAFPQVGAELVKPKFWNFTQKIVGLHFIQPNLQPFPNSPFVLASSGFLSGLETYLFERSEFGESP